MSDLVQETYRSRKVILQDIEMRGYSVAGIGTSLWLPQWDICFDVGSGNPLAANINNYFITHGHMDHASGIPYIVSQKGLCGLKPGNFYVPSHLVEPFYDLMKCWEKIDEFKYEFEFIGCNPGDRIDVKPFLVVKPFKTVHRIRSQGYTLLHKKKKLKPEYQDLSRDDIMNLKYSGKSIEEEVLDPLVSFTGDTQIDFLDVSPEVKKSKILILEVSYFDERKSIEDAKKWGHIHLDELLPRLKEIHSEKIVFIHPSRRYSENQIHDILRHKIASSELDRIEIFW